MHINVRPHLSEDRHGFSIIEIVVAMIIVSVLTLILVPSISNRARQARINATQEDLQRIADAQERVAMDTGYFFRLYAMDDVLGGDGREDTDPEDRVDGTDDIELSMVHTTPKKIFIDPVTQDFVNNYENIYDNQFAGPGSPVTTDTPTDAQLSEARRDEEAFGFFGPYLNWKRDINGNDWPDDPWGNDYLIFSRRGGLFPRRMTSPGVPDTADTDPPDDQFIIAPQLGPTGAEVDGFDRLTILSLGPDGLPGNGNLNPDGDGVYGTGDDIFVHVGG